MKKNIQNLSLSVLLLCSVYTLVAQDKQSEVLNIYLDGAFDESFVKENFTIVNYVRDRLVADVHVQLSQMRTASGGRKYTIEFMGQQKFSQLQDTLIFFLQSNFSKDEKRIEILKNLKLGLVPYLLRTPLLEHDQ